MRAILVAIGLTLVSALPGYGFEIEEESWFGEPGGGTELHILSSTDTEIFVPLILAYRERHPGIAIRYVVTNTQDLFGIVDEGAEAFDLAISSAMDLQIKLANDGKALVHRSEQTERLPAWALWRDQLFAFTQEPVVAAYAADAFGTVAPPRTREELIQLIRSQPEMFEGRIGTYDPNLSGAGYLFATQDARQSDTYWRLSEVMGAVKPVLYASTGAMIEDLQNGRLVLAYNVLGPYLAERLKNWPGGGLIEFRDYTHVLLRTAFIPSNASHAREGHAFLDFLLSREGQRLIAENTSLPRIDESALAEAPHLRPIRLDPGLLVYVDPLKKRSFLNEWTSAVIQP